MGASRGRLFQQLLAESAVLCVVGTVLGVLIGSIGVDLLITIDKTAIPRTEAVGLSGPVVAYAVGLGAVTALLFGVLPTLYTRRSTHDATKPAEIRAPDIDRSIAAT